MEICIGELRDLIKMSLHRQQSDIRHQKRAARLPLYRRADLEGFEAIYTSVDLLIDSRILIMAKPQS